MCKNINKINNYKTKINKIKMYVVFFYLEDNTDYGSFTLPRIPKSHFFFLENIQKERKVLKS